MEKINDEPQIDDDPVEKRDNDDEEDDDEDDQFDYGDGFLVDSSDDGEDEEEEQRPCTEKKSGNRRKKDQDFSLHEDDYLLLEDNNANFERKKYKRWKKSTEEEININDDDDDDDDDLSHFIVDEDSHGVRKINKFKQGTDSNALRYANDLFGDPEELLKLRRKDLAYNEKIERKIEDEFGPMVLSEKYMTERDDEIRKLDVPERMQISEETFGVAPVDESSIEEESHWIYARLVQEQGLCCLVNKDDIVRFLELYHVQKLEIPFIAMYRKEQCLSLLDSSDHDDGDKKLETKWHKVLWMIQDLDRKWLLLRKRKTALFGYYTKRFEEETCRSDLNKSLFESVIKSLEASETEREVDDVDSKFNLHFPLREIDEEGQYKRPNRKSQYNICSKFGIREFANKFGYSAEQLGLALSLEKVLVEDLEDAKETPEEMALNYVCAMFEDPQAVLKGARHVAAVEISCEVLIKKYLRGIYMENAVVSTSPTPDGNVVIDSFHRFSAVKWLREKPLRKFEGVQWLLIQKAEEEKLLQVTFKLPENHMNRIISECNEHYLSVGVSKYAQIWNEQRKLILEDAVHGFLLPSMEKEARSLLTSRAKTRLLSEYGQVLWNKVSSGPYQRNDKEAVPRVLACCWGPGTPETTFVMLDSSGELLDVLYAGSLALRLPDVNDQQRKKKEQDRLSKFITEHQPDVVALGAVNMSCLRLKDKIYEVIFEIVEELGFDVINGFRDILVVYADESLPRLYENSRISSEQLPQQPGIVKRAVALGRYLQNPLAMISTLCGPCKDILSWKLHSLQDFLDPDEKYEMVEQVMVDITNQVGIDINLAASHEWLFSPLQFVSGFGPRKASSLQKSLVRAGSIFVRKELINHGIGKKVFVNAAGFLRIRRSGSACNSSQFIDLLDDTRIHPESYGPAQELAKDVYAHDGIVRGGEDDAIEMAIEHVRDQPASLRRIVLDEYLRSKNQDNKKETYRLIMRELICGFQDWRSPFKAIDADEEFYMFSGETKETIGEGRIVQATVQKVTSGKAICALDCRLPGILSKEDYSDNGRDIVDLSNKLCEGDMVTCKIISIQKNRYRVLLVCKESEMRKNINFEDVDEYYHEEEQNNAMVEKEKAPKEKKQFKSRMIVHPRFQNITAEQAAEYLSDKNIGESIVRPSSRGLNHLTLMIKIFDNVYANKEIIEGDKESKDIVSLQRIGKTLKIGNETFEDLDEVMDRYADPLVTHLMTMINYRKFRTGTKSEIDDLLRVEKGENPKMVVYGFDVSHEHPGSFILSYIRSANPHHEYIGLYPKGFKFRKRMFGDLDKLAAYFKRHIDDPVHYYQ
ncbi:PREDICTED: LOW QUALITY PROTEIN: transcription elongation factor SPT6-like [Camelina sativa]|uniref:Transcription elongation factor spt6 n=1 Tax=Camelina sativa TaxID=90675 RepID=A0ABM0WN84_CAMSA|nr:PREDICTED: LOW QUALITY PROTEIN: transcription elongation factor SPT6-like [Camelina sativa]